MLMVNHEFNFQFDDGHDFIISYSVVYGESLVLSLGALRTWGKQGSWGRSRGASCYGEDFPTKLGRELLISCCLQRSKVCDTRGD